VITSTITGTTTLTSTQATTVTSTSTSTQTTIAQPILLATLPSTSSPISQAGSSLLYPLFELWAANFTQMYKNVQLNTAAGGSGAGLSGVEANTINIGASDPFMTSAQSSAYPGILNIPVAVSSQAVNYNLPMIPQSTHLNFTGNVLAGIYNGTITYWDNAAIKNIQSASVAALLPHQLIIPLHRSDSSGDTNLFTTYLSDTSADWLKNYGSGNTVAWASVPTAQADSGNSGMLTGADQTEYSIAYIGVSYQAQATTDNLGSGALQNTAGVFLPLTTTTVSAAVNAQYASTPPNEKVSLIYGPGANSYPIVNFEYVLVQQAQPNTTLQQDIQAILWYATLPQYGQSPYFLNSPATGSLGFLPLPTSIAQLSWAQINSITG
jgi:phosphate transport system substrate-binding protein